MRPTSDQSKKAAGTFRPAVARPPMGVPIAIPQPPEELSEAARKEWAYVVPELAESGVLARADRRILSIYCELAAEFAEAPRKMSAGKLKELRMLCAEMGLSISSRLKMKAPEGAKPQVEPCQPKPGGKVVSFSDRLSSTLKALSPDGSTPADTSSLPASDN